MLRADREEFESSFQVTPGCWNWAGRLWPKGYGQFQGSLTAHRVAYELYVGEIPRALLIRHKCDNRVCVNPDHLEPGTALQNTQDAVARGRMASGERNGRATVTTSTVQQIRDLLKCGLFSQNTIASFYEVKRSLVSDIKLNRCWQSL